MIDIESLRFTKKALAGAFLYVVVLLLTQGLTPKEISVRIPKEANIAL